MYNQKQRKNYKVSINRIIIRNKLKDTYQPLILKAMKPLQFIRNRSSSLAEKPFLENKEKFKKLYSLLSNKYILIQALGNISKNKGVLTPGTDNKTYDAMNIRRIEILSKKIKNGTFKFSPYRRKFIPKPTKKGQPPKLRPLGIPNFDDRIVQEAIRIILEAIYEPLFENYNYNFGFRKTYSPHDAIETIKKKGTACDFAIEGDIKGAFDNVDSNVMANCLMKRIGDTKFIKLIQQGFKCGLLEQGTYKDTLLGVPQGGIASPILFNIYMHEFDMFIHNELSDIIALKNSNEKRNSKGSNNRIYLNINQRITRNKATLYQLIPDADSYSKLPFKMQQKVKILTKLLHKDYILRSQTPSVLQSKRSIRIIYVRYADDWIILTNANRSYCNDIKNIIGNKLKNDLKLELSIEKTKVTNLKNDSAKFLGFSIRTYRNTNLISDGIRLKRTAGYSILIGIDMDRMLNKLIVNGFCKDKSGHRPIAKSSYTVLTIQNIIETYNYMIRGASNYYFPMLSRVKDMIRIIYIYEYSAYMTIAKKLSTKISKIRERFGKPLTYTISQLETVIGKSSRLTTKTFTLLDYLTTKHLIQNMITSQKNAKDTKRLVNSDIFNPMYKINWRTLRNLNSACCICGTTENVELHHIHRIRVGKVEGFNQVLKQLNRKTIPLCREHHLAAEKGLLNDVKISQLYFIEEWLA